MTPYPAEQAHRTCAQAKDRDNAFIPCGPFIGDA